MGERAARQRCAAIVQCLPIPHPWDVEAFCGLIAEQRQRPITLLQLALPPRAPCGIFIATATADYIAVTEAAMGRRHREHIVLHEMAHLLLAHRAETMSDPDATRLLMPDLDPGVVREMFARTRYDDATEHDAELLATLISVRVAQWAQAPRKGAVQPTDAAIVQRLSGSLEHEVPTCS